MSMRAPALAGAMFAAFIGLGAAVDRFGPWAWDRGVQAGDGWLSFWMHVAMLGTFPAYVALGLALLVAGVVAARVRRAAIWTVVGLALLWQFGDAVKLLFHRPRPPAWHGIHEASYSYPSGHAELSLFFYGAVALWFVLPHLRGAARYIALGICAALPLAIAASRPALGVHYVTDLVGGWLLAGAWLAVLSPVARPSPSLERAAGTV